MLGYHVLSSNGLIAVRYRHGNWTFKI